MDEPKDERRIVVTKDGPYRVEGGVPLLRTAIVETERGEPVAWDEGPAFETPDDVYELCRCGKSSTKPFCDSTHERIPFDGTETADRGPIANRREAWEGEAGHVLYDDLSLCTHAGFCRNVRTGVWEMVEEADDPEVRTEFTAMVQRCPSGRLAFAILPDPEPVEAHVRAVDRRRARRELLDPRRDPGRVRGRDAVRGAQPPDRVPVRAVAQQAVLRRLAQGVRVRGPRDAGVNEARAVRARLP